MNAPQFDPKAEWVLGMPARGYTHAVMSGGYCVADIMECSGHEERNARLIVAAPELYAAIWAEQAWSIAEELPLKVAPMRVRTALCAWYQHLAAAAMAKTHGEAPPTWSPQPHGINLLTHEIEASDEEECRALVDEMHRHAALAKAEGVQP